jgi:hypothetical protein
LYREKDLEAGKDGERFLDRIPQKVSRAKKHHQETFIDTQAPSDYNDPAGRVFPVLQVRKKKPKAVEKG